MDKHELIVALKDLALRLGRTPSRDEWLSQSEIKQPYLFQNAFGNWTLFVQAAGLDPIKQKKIDNSIFERNIEQHLSSYIEKELAPAKPTPNLHVISDIHWPFASKRIIDKFFESCLKHQPEWVILNGDAWDMYSHSKFPRSHNVFTPREEQALARKMNEEFWAEVRRLCPHAKCVQMLGNHEIRPMKRVLESYPEIEDWVSKYLGELLSFDGVKTVMDPRDELVLGDTAIFHGYRSGLGQHRDFTLMNAINGHTHKGGVVFRQIRGRVLWELNSGLAGDAQAKGLTYTPQRITDWTPGFGRVIDNVPMFVPC